MLGRTHPPALTALQAKEGLIAEGTPAWQDMSVNDRNKRKRAAGAGGVLGVAPPSACTTLYLCCIRACATATPPAA